MYEEPFSYGHPVSPQPTDPTFDTLEETLAAALKHQHDSPFDTILAVWGNGSGEVFYLVFDGQVFVPQF